MSANLVAPTHGAPGLHRVRIEQADEVYLCAESETLLQGMARLGCKGIPVGCLGGGCGVCKIQVRVGSVRRVGVMSRSHVSAEEEVQGICLACRVAPLESVEVEVLGKMKRALGRALGFQWSPGAASKSASDRETVGSKET